MAFALPAASVPPISVQKTRPTQSASRPGSGAGHLARGEDHRRHRRDQQQLDDPRLRQRDVGADRVAAWSRAPRGRRPGRRSRPRRSERGGRCADAGRVVARDRQPGQHRPDDRAERQVQGLRPLGQAASGPGRRRSTTWIANRTAEPTASRTSVGWSRWVRHATTARRGDDDARRPRPPSDGGRARRSRR